jgi:hypothetical protein
MTTAELHGRKAREESESVLPIPGADDDRPMKIVPAAFERAANAIQKRRARKVAGAEHDDFPDPGVDDFFGGSSLADLAALSDSGGGGGGDWDDDIPGCGSGGGSGGGGPLQLTSFNNEPADVAGDDTDVFDSGSNELPDPGTDEASGDSGDSGDSGGEGHILDDLS